MILASLRTGLALGVLMTSSLSGGGGEGSGLFALTMERGDRGDVDEGVDGKLCCGGTVLVTA